MDGMTILRLFGQGMRLAVPAAASFSALFYAGYRVSSRGQKEDGVFPYCRWLVLTLLVGWAAAVVGLTLVFRVPGAGETGANLMLLRAYINAWSWRSAAGWQQIVFNILMFEPLGLLLPFLGEKGVGFRAACFVSLGATGLIETAQLITRRGFFDVDDLLNNLLGAMLGYCAAALARRWAREGRPDRRLLARLAAVLFALALALLLGLAACRLRCWSAAAFVPEKPRHSAQPRRTRTEQPKEPLPPLLFRRPCPLEYIERALAAPGAPLASGYARMWFDVRLPVRALLQTPQLRNGCEAASLAALLNYKGVAADKLDLAYAYIPREDFIETPYGLVGPDPERAYPGDPATMRGYYCFAVPLARGANRYLRDYGSPMHAFNVTGVTAAGLEQYLRGGDPVVVWVTRALDEPYTGASAWILPDSGEVYVPYMNLHCVVLMGWGRDTCELMDPLQGVCTVDKQAFLASFEQLGRRALVIH